MTKKLIFVMGILLLVPLVLAACGGTQEEQDSVVTEEGGAATYNFDAAGLINNVEVTVYYDAWKSNVRLTTRARVTWHIYDSDKNLLHSRELGPSTGEVGGTWGGYIVSGEDGHIRIEIESESGEVQWWPGEDEMYRIERTGITAILSQSEIRVPTEAPGSPAIVDPSSVWKLQRPLYFITGHRTPQGGIAFHKMVDEVLGGGISLFGGYPRFEGIEEYIDNMRERNSILMMYSNVNLEELREFAEKYPELLPVSYDELTHYPLPLIYFAVDESRNVVRGIMITERINISLADLLLEEGIQLGVALRHQDQQLVRLERSTTTW